MHSHPNLKRRLSVRECARCQSFPDDFIFYGSNLASYAHIGNAVAPLFAFFIANEIREFFDLKKLDEISWNLPYSLPEVRMAFASPTPHPITLLSWLIFIATHLWIAYAFSRSPFMPFLISSDFCLTIPSA
ncbi:MAG: DNA cytosine methyltransferase [Campylobacter sp.]|nr:DNA cytosine methyltransferase [Campylobacter sp.]